MINPFYIRGHSNQYAYFRQKNQFIDCEYHVSKKTYYAHKLVLSIFSKLLRNHFLNKSPDSDNDISYKLPIPYNESMFEELVNYFYDTNFKLDKIDSSHLLPWLSMGYIYDVKTINEIIEPIISERFLYNPKDENLDIILRFSEYYKNVRLNPQCFKEFEGIEENVQNFMKSQNLFVSYLGDRFEVIEQDRKRLSKLTPYLISEILKHKDEKDYDDIRKARILENYVKVLRLAKENLTIKDREILQDVISWEKDDSYELFTHSDLDWILPKVARPQIIKLLRARRKTLRSLNDSSIQSQPQINHWYAISCVNNIETAHEKTDEPYSIIHFIGTLGNSNKVDFINPKKYHFLKSNFCPSLSDSANYDDLSIFDEGAIDEKTYFLSDCVDLSQIKSNSELPYAGFDLPDSRISIEQVTLTSSVKRPNDRPQKMKLILDQKESISAQIQDKQLIFNLHDSEQKASSIKLQIDTVKPTTPLFFSLRVHRLQVYGKFLPEV
ncbi:hypothetical protein M9Y10_004944 [Tritrichomonas musculus]|uniref:BTB domain-containing protein n=1 Tax=Tritrichomonas musculus TaxID=1915356 RepID=A0ABR2JJW5_9EUKA